MIFKKIMLYLLIIIIVFLAILVIFGLIFKPKEQKVLIKPQTKDVNKSCTKNSIECNPNDLNSCNNCNDNVEIKCQKLNDTDKKYYCLPKKPDAQCNSKNGGLWVWSGWSDIDKMEWDCLCNYPHISSNKGCTNLNFGVCEGGTWKYDAVTDKRPPNFDDCQCPENTVKIKRPNSEIPMCISQEICGGFGLTDIKGNISELCKNFYNNNSSYLK